MKALHITPAPQIAGDQSELLDVSLSRSKSARAQQKDELSEFIHSSQAEALKDYKLKKVVGQGAFGQVVVGRHIPTGDRVAVKVVKDILKHSMLARSAIRELSILRQLSEFIAEGAYPHMVTLREALLFYSAPDEVSLAIVMECGNLDLHQVLQSESKSHLTRRGFLNLIYSLLCSLNFLESAGVLHRDVKPMNILLNNDFSIKLCDFGLARTAPERAQPRLLHKSVAPQPSSSSGQPNSQGTQKKRNLSPHIVTRQYRPPEVILMLRDYDYKIDVWSAGVSLLETFNAAFSVLDPSGINPFVGTYCHPLSPLRKKREKSDRDQLQSILAILGKQDEEDLAFLESAAQIKQVKKFEPEIGKIDFAIEYSESSPKLMNLFNKMLSFSPHLRYSASELLASRLFEKVRKPEMEKPAPRRVHVDIDKAGVYDYAKQEAVTMTKDDHIRSVIKEIRKLRKRL